MSSKKVMPLEWVMKEAERLGIDLSNPKLFGSRIAKKSRKVPGYVQKVIDNRSAAMDPSRYDYPLDFPCVGPCLDENGKPVWVNDVTQGFSQDDYMNFLKTRYGEDAVNEVMLDPMEYADNEDTYEQLRELGKSVVSGNPLELRNTRYESGFMGSGGKVVDLGPMRKFAKVHGNGDVEFQKVAPGRRFEYSIYSDGPSHNRYGFQGYISGDGETSPAHSAMRSEFEWNGNDSYPRYMYMPRPLELKDYDRGRGKYVSEWGGAWVNPKKMIKSDLDMIRNPSLDWADESRYATPGGWESSVDGEYGTWKRNISAKKTHDLNELAPGNVSKIVKKSRKGRPESASPYKYTDSGDRYNVYFGDSWFMKDAKRKADEIREKKARAELEERKKAIEAEISKLQKKLDKKNKELNTTDSLSQAVGQSVWKYPKLH